MADTPEADPNQAPAPQTDAADEDTPMEFHKPKPVHNWQEFLSEIGVVVIGVCIALAAEQGVEWLHWRNQVAQSREMIASEMAINLSSAGRRLATQACIESRLDEIARILDSASRTGSLPPIGDIGFPVLGNWDSGTWQSVVSSETATHFTRAELTDLAHTYYYVDKASGYVPLENQAWYELAAMVGPGRRLDPASEAELRKALNLARGYSRDLASLSINLVGAAKSHPLPFSRDDLNRIAAAKAAVADAIPGNATSARTLCRPIGPAPAQYGDVGFVVPPETIAKSLTVLPGAATPPAP